jgi:error-prone DNA polymerase
MYLNLHSQYSLKYGTMSIKQLVECAVAKGIDRMALTDINNSSGAMEFVDECQRAGIEPIVGIEFRRDGRLLYIGLARNREGFKELNEFLTFHNLNNETLPDLPWSFNDAVVIYPYSRLEWLQQELDELREQEYIGIRSTELNKLFGKPLSKIKDRLVALHPVTVCDAIEHRMHHYLRAIDLNTLLSKVAENDLCQADETMLTESELRDNFASYPSIILNTERLLNACSIQVDLKVSKNLKLFTKSYRDDNELLEKLATEGMYYRYGRNHKQAQKKLKEELAVIKDLKFCAYFLITSDIVDYALKHRYYHVGRGSGANSLVAYCLRITEVDPLELDLYFERFLNKQRTSPPDFDIDFSWDERGDVQDYIVKRYGTKHTALLGTMTTFQGKSVLREIGKVLGLPKAEIDSFSNPAKDAENRSNPVYQKIMALYTRMKEMPHQRSIHAGGVLISEEPITYYSALDMPPKGLQTVQFDMYNAAMMGFEKFDILSQRGIGHIKEAVDVIYQNHQVSVDAYAFKKFKADPVINGQLKSGDTIGAFYIESPAMRGLLKKLKCDNYLNLVAASSIIRPGVAQSGMMKAYIERYNHPEKIEYLHPVMKEQLAETYGVMVYQEDVIKICHHYGGLDLDDADVLRRGMSGKWRSKLKFDRLVQRFFDKAKALGRDEATTREVWRQVSSFAGYSFSKAHSASFAVESYQSLFLKTYYPREFMVAVLNNYGGFYRRWVYVNELRKAGATVHLPCVNESEDKVTIRGIEAWLGLIGIQGLEDKFKVFIPQERLENGPYQSLENFIRRTGMMLEQCLLLIRVGALRFTGRTKKELLWDVHKHIGSKLVAKQETELFAVEAKSYRLPELAQARVEDAYDEIELLDYPLTMSFYELSETERTTDMLAGNLMGHVGKTVTIIGNYVCEKTVHTIKKECMYFGTFQDLEGNWFDTVHFPQSAPVYPFRGVGCYHIEGRVVEEFGFASIEVSRFEKLPLKPDPRREI